MSHVSRQKLKQIHELMKDGKGRTAAQAADDLEIGKGETYRAMKILYDEKEIRITDWRVPKGGGLVAVYSIGEGRDIQKPVLPYSRRVNDRKSKPTRVSHAEKERRKLAAEEAEKRRMASEIRPFRHWQDEVFYGPYVKPESMQIAA